MLKSFVLALAVAGVVCAEGTSPAVKPGPRTVAGVTWAPLDAALAKAKSTGRPVVWLRILGDLEGKS